MNRGGGKQQSSRGRPQHNPGRHVIRPSNVGFGSHSDDTSLAQETEPSTSEKKKSGSVSGLTKQLNNMSTPGSGYRSNCTPHHGGGRVSPNVGYSKVVQNVREADQTPKQFESPFFGPSYGKSSARSSQSIRSQVTCTPPASSVKEPSLTEHSGSQGGQVCKEVQTGVSSSGDSSKDKGDSADSDNQHKGFSYDICIKSTGAVVKLKTSILVRNREKRNAMKRQEIGDNIKILRPGMVLLKGYLNLVDQVKIVKSCRDLGRGSGGFYQPGYRDGAKLSLKMMCLGKDWDPETNLYGDIRSADKAIPPLIPNELQHMVEGAIQESHDYLKSCNKKRNVEDTLPSMSPNICIVNFYTKSGKLGLHQDKDESPESLRKGLPVVSFSIGDSAEFLYGDERNIDKVDKVVLESGDVLIFGGQSRHVFHGVSSILPETAPKALEAETNIRPGRLNLTFREY